MIFAFFSFLSYHHGQKRRLANQKSVDKKQPLDDGGGVFFQFCFGTCHRCPSQRVLQSLPQGLWNLRACQKRRGEKLIFPQMEGFFRPKIEAHSQLLGMYTWSVTVTGEALVSLIKEGHELKEGHVIKPCCAGYDAMKSYPVVWGLW